MPKKYDFCGYATRENVRCGDGRTITHGAFSKDDGKTVPLVWQHAHGDLTNILGHALLESRPDGMYAYANFNQSENGQLAKQLVEHGDITRLSIFANDIVENGAGLVSHGSIKEVSLVYAGANPGAYIENVMAHGEVDETSAVMNFGPEAAITEIQNGYETPDVVEHADKDDDKDDGKQKTVQEIIDSMTDEQKAVTFGLAEEMLKIGAGEEDDDDKEDDDDDKGGSDVKHNAFEGGNAYTGAEAPEGATIITSEMQHAAIADAKRFGTLKASCIEHGITNVEYLFPEAKPDSPVPTWYSRDMAWVSDVMNGVSRSPFSRIKSQFADITEDDARAKGYIKGKLKKEEVFSLLKRTTGPTTVYKKQRMERDDVIDITDFDVISWIKSEMRVMLNEELARAFLIGDGRLSSSDDKIDEQNIRPIAYDDDFYTIKTSYTKGADYKKTTDAIVEALTIARKDYKGSGNPVAFVNEDLIVAMTLAQDLNGRYIYETLQSIATKLRVSKIVSVPVFEGYKGQNNGKLMAVVVNLRDYRVGADKGGAVQMFDDFDIDYNAMKYLIETRCSGALTVPKSAIVLEEVSGSSGD